MDEKRRTGLETKAEIQRVAVSLFSSQGYENTSLRQIAEVVGIRKASLYYHFASKEEIVRSTFESRGSEARDLAEWTRNQPDAPDLAERVVLRWVESFSADKLQGIRFANANAALIRTLAAGGGERIGDGLREVTAVFAERGWAPGQVLLLNMAMTSINAAVFASSGLPVTDEQIVGSAREAALGLLSRVGNHPMAKAAPKQA